MGFFEAIQSVFSKYFQFSGRARRSEYWFFALFTLIVTIVLSVADAALFGYGPTSPTWLNDFFSLITFIPSLSVSVRRLHDVNRSGWWILLTISALIIGVTLYSPYFALEAEMPNFFGDAPPVDQVTAGIVLLLAFGLGLLLFVWSVISGTDGENRYGPDPKDTNPSAEVFA
jgi:uncharacterized membrane protein YhaH (DUF805 family)